MANFGSTVSALRCFLTVFRDSPVRRAISRIDSFRRSDMRRITFKSSMLITPLPPAANCLGGRVTWVNSQRKLRAQVSHFWVEISSEAIVRQRLLVVPHGNPWLFPGVTIGQPVREIQRFWAKAQRDADPPDLHIHDLRHTFASLLVSGGASLEMIGKFLGHSQT